MTTAAPVLPGCSVLPPMETVAKMNGKPKGKRQTAERFAVLNAFVDVTAGELSRSEIMVWLVLYRDTKNGTARTSQADIARRGGLSVRSVAAAIGKLRGRGLLSVVRRGGLQCGPSTYRVHPLGESYKMKLASCC